MQSMSAPRNASSDINRYFFASISLIPISYFLIPISYSYLSVQTCHRRRSDA